MTGRRPKRSESAPRIGAQKNCMTEYSATSSPKTNDASLMAPPSMLWTSLGRIGMTRPMPRMSMNRVIRTNTTLACLLRIPLLEKERQLLSGDRRKLATPAGTTTNEMVPDGHSVSPWPPLDLHQEGSLSSGQDLS